MAIKMAKGSLFAVLLRSPWWYSIIIGLLILAISLFFTDAQYVILSIAGSMPFFAIGCFAAYKQLQHPSAKRVAEVTEHARTMSAGIIAEKIAANYVKSGYESRPFKANGADLELVRGNKKLLLSCKRFKAANTGLEPLKLIVAAGEKADASGYLYLTLGEITDSAYTYAKKHNIELIEASRFAALFDGRGKVE